MRKIIFLSLLLFAGLFSDFLLGESIKERFEGNGKLTYKVYFNNLPVGSIEWVYLGREIVEDRDVDALSINSDTSILKLLNLRGKEKVFLDIDSHLPIKVERDIVFFGKRELIKEIYNQNKGFVKIVKNNSKKQEKILYQDKPIYHILSLLYFFPQDIELTIGKLLTFNLPTQRVKIKVSSYKSLSLQGEKKEAIFLVGKGAQRFNLWLDRENRMPLRLDFILPLGKIVISRDY
jgi:hypothetical protein